MTTINYNIYQRVSLPVLFLFFCFLASCGGKNNKPAVNTGVPVNESDTNRSARVQPVKDADTTLTSVKASLETGLSNWIQSFKNFHIDSFRQLEVRQFQQNDYEEVGDMSEFYSFYKASLSFSPDSSQFIDLYSNGISLERKGKKIIAIGDADQAVTLCNLKTKSWKNIVYFGPSAGMEEALWLSPVKFILAGTMQNDDGKHQAVLLLCNTEEKSLRWFEGNVIRSESSKYVASGFSKLKIDEWE